jgi:hypothetical protein
MRRKHIMQLKHCRSMRNIYYFRFCMYQVEDVYIRIKIAHIQYMYENTVPSLILFYIQVAVMPRKHIMQLKHCRSINPTFLYVSRKS